MSEINNGDMPRSATSVTQSQIDNLFDGMVLGEEGSTLEMLQAVRDLASLGLAVENARYWSARPTIPLSEKSNVERDLLERALPLLRGHVHGGALVEMIEAHLKVDGDGQPYVRADKPQHGGRPMTLRECAEAEEPSRVTNTRNDDPLGNELVKRMREIQGDFRVPDEGKVILYGPRAQRVFEVLGQAADIIEQQEATISKYDMHVLVPVDEYDRLRSSTARVNDRCQNCPGPSGGVCIYPRCGDDAKEVLEGLLKKYAFDLFGVTSTHGFCLPLLGTTPQLYLLCGEKEQIARLISASSFVEKK